MNEANVTTLMYSNSFVENSPIFGNIYIQLRYFLYFVVTLASFTNSVHISQPHIYQPHISLIL